MQGKFDRIYVPDLKWRQIKVVVDSGAWIVAKRKFMNHDSLREWLHRIDGSSGIRDVYFSVSCFLRPEFVYGYKERRLGFSQLDRIVLKSDFVFDFDSKNGEDVYPDALRVYNVCRRAYDEVVFLRTGRGVHVYVLDWYGKFCRRDNHPDGRWQYINSMKRRFAKIFWKSGIVFDFPTSIDSFRVCRVWNSYHNTGVFCDWFKDVDFDSSSLPEREFLGVNPVRVETR